MADMVRQGSVRRSARKWLAGASALIVAIGLGLLAPDTARASVSTPLDGSAAQRSNVPGLSSAEVARLPVTRQGSRLMLGQHPFRMAGANVEWLGLKNYGPNPSDSLPQGSEAFPSRFEVDDALATAHEMGVTVIRSQTLGDTVGCPQCLEPRRGVFSARAFAHMDMVVAEAHRYGIKLIGEFDGDANGAPPAGTSENVQSHHWYCAWEGIPASRCGAAMYTDKKVRADYTRHMAAVLNHVNPLTGMAYKNDPILLGWVDGNNLNLTDGQDASTFNSWLTEVSRSFKRMAPHQLFVNISLGGGDGWVAPEVLAIPGVDIYGREDYPHWSAQIGAGMDIGEEADQTAAAGKAFAVIEYGWDHTNQATTTDLANYLAGFASNSHIAGDAFWALQAHAAGHGWQPVPADAGCRPDGCATGEDGNWWALYYTGRKTLSNTPGDMAARAQVMRRHAYAVDGYDAAPPHERVPAPVVTSTADGLVEFQGAAGAGHYTVQKLSGHVWRTVATDITDATGSWRDSATTGCYRVTGLNLDGRPGRPSAPAGPGCMPSLARR